MTRASGGGSPALAGSDYAVRGAGSKLLLVAGSIAFILLLSRSWTVTAFVLLTVSGIFFLTIVADRLLKDQLTRNRTAATFIVIALAALVIGNLSGAIGTVTGGAESIAHQWPVTLGLSFYALQAAGVASDVLRRNIPRPQLLDYLVFTLLGFKFLSGPLERAVDLERIVNQAKPLTVDRAWDAFGFIVLGFFLKYVVADPLSALVILDTTSPVATLCVAAAAELRVYFDLAGYSFLAFGLAGLAGIDLTLNFRQPFQSPNIREFWLRWHISLGAWIRQYVYLPARPWMISRKLPTNLLILVTFLVSALWHGVSLNYGLWGLTHAIAFIAFVRGFARRTWPRPVGLAALVSLLVFTRILFIDSDAGRLLGKLADFGEAGAWRGGFSGGLDPLAAAMSGGTMAALGFAGVFLLLEPLSLRLYAASDYRLFRTMPFLALMLALTVMLLHGHSNGFVYARH